MMKHLEVFIRVPFGQIKNMTKHPKQKKNLFKMSKLDRKRMKAKKKRLKNKKRAKLALLKLNKLMDNDKKHISEDECDFDFDNSGRPLCSTSEDDSDGPQGNI